jgi:hypothetical protein
MQHAGCACQPFEISPEGIGATRIQRDQAGGGPEIWMDDQQRSAAIRSGLQGCVKVLHMCDTMTPQSPPESPFAHVAASTIDRTSST